MHCSYLKEGKAYISAQDGNIGFHKVKQRVLQGGVISLMLFNVSYMPPEDTLRLCTDISVH